MTFTSHESSTFGAIVMLRRSAVVAAVLLAGLLLPLDETHGQGGSRFVVSTSGETCSFAGIPADHYRRELNEQFTALLGSSQAVPGSFGALEIDKDQKAKLAATSQPGDGVVVGVEASGGVQDGLLGLISGKQAASTFSMAVNVHLLRKQQPAERKLDVNTDPLKGLQDDLTRALEVVPRAGEKRSMLQYTNTSCHASLNAHRRANDSLALWIAAIELDADLIERRLRLGRLSDSIRTIDSLLAIRAVGTLEHDKLRLDRSRLAILKSQLEQAPSEPKARQILAALQKRSEMLRSAEALLEITGFSLGWFSMSAGVENTVFKRFDPAAVVDSQVFKGSHAAPRVGVAYSRYTLSQFPNESRFWSVGVNAGLTDNLTELTKVELTDTKQHGANPEDRVAKTTVTAFEGAYENGLREMDVTADWYQFLFRDNQGAIHVFPGVSLREKLGPTYTAGIGFLWTLRKDKAAFFNAEIQFRLTDISEATPSSDNVWERSQLGLQIVFPILFNPR